MSSPKKHGWSRIETEARHAFAGAGRFPLPAYSEYMPPPYVGIKPYAPTLASAAATAAATQDGALDITEYEVAQELVPGLERIATKVLDQVAKAARGAAHEMSRTLLADNPAWPAALVDAAKAGRFASSAFNIVLSVALSRTQDDKGNVRWTLFGVSHEGAAAPVWASFEDERAAARLARLIAFVTAGKYPSLEGVRVIAKLSELPEVARPLHLAEGASLAGVEVIVTFRPFAALSPAVQQAYLAGKLELVPSPGSLVFFEHPLYRKLATALPRAMQIPLLHLFPRVQGGYGIRIPQSGWLDELGAGHRVESAILRSHRWQRVSRDDDVEANGALADPVSVALFSASPDHLNLYGKPMARNAQVWRDDYRLLLDGPRATALELERAANTAGRGGRFGYRLYYPPMRAGRRELFWHLPLVARIDAGEAKAALFTLRSDDAPLGTMLAEPLPEEAYLPRVCLAPRRLARPGHLEAATLFDHEPGRKRFTTCHNIRRLLDFHQMLGAPLSPALARALLRAARGQSLDDWLARLAETASDKVGGERVAAQLRELIGPPRAPGAGEPLVLEGLRSREFEEGVWRTIQTLATAFHGKDNADAVAANLGRSGGAAAAAAHVEAARHRDLERLGDDLHARYHAIIAKHGMQERAFVADQDFHWETGFDMAWSDGWAKNQQRRGHERNIVCVIPGRDRGQAVIMADHYDTAYMEDVYDKTRGGDGLRAAAAGADDNHSATTALLYAAETLLPLSRDGKLARDVWLVHLTGEEFPADCLGARALAQALIERRLRLTAEDGAIIDLSRTRAAGVYVLDMIAHNHDRDRDVFQISPGEGVGSARLAVRAHLANQRWNALVREWNQAEGRAGKGRAARRDESQGVPPPFAHLELSGEIRTEWEPRSSLFNTDGQIFSDVGIPVVLFMENYDLNRSGYHDTHDTMKNVDLDYAAALTAIAIESVADAASAPEI